MFMLMTFTYASCTSLQESAESSDRPQTYSDMLTTKEIPEISNDRTRVLPVGPLAPVNAVMLWGAAVALLITVVSMATTEWAVKSTNHMGLWRVCAHYLCVSSAYLLLGGKHYQTGNDIVVSLEV